MPVFVQRTPSESHPGTPSMLPVRHSESSNDTQGVPQRFPAGPPFRAAHYSSIKKSNGGQTSLSQSFTVLFCHSTILRKDCKNKSS
eukprot:1159070-Pelagomonas_calceolata.AAC.2